MSLYELVGCCFLHCQVLQQEGVEYIVAPYEADAQMAYLALNDLVQVVITEDSDLIAYGCPRVCPAFAREYISLCCICSSESS